MFTINSRGRDGSVTYKKVCKACWNKQESERYRKKKEFVDAQKTQCKKCGDDRFYVLDFHHIDPNSKKFTIGQFKKGSFKKLQDEIDKCVVLCANCHREYHYLKKEYDITLTEYLNEDYPVRKVV